jgi:hypothetical protein
VPSPTLMQTIANNDLSDDLQYGNSDKAGGVIASTVGPFTVPGAGNVTRPEIYLATSVNVFGMKIVVQTGGARAVNMSVVPVDPIALTEFSDIPNGQLFFPILFALMATTYQSWGLDTTATVPLGFSFAFKLRWDESGIGSSVSVSYNMWGFAVMNRGLLVE